MIQFDDLQDGPEDGNLHGNSFLRNGEEPAEFDVECYHCHQHFDAELGKMCPHCGADQVLGDEAEG